MNPHITPLLFHLPLHVLAFLLFPLSCSILRSIWYRIPPVPLCLFPFPSPAFFMHCFFSVRSFQQKNSLSLPNFPQPCPKRQFPWWCVYLLCSLSTIIISCILSISPAVSLSAVSLSFFMRFTSLESPPRPFQWIFCPSHFSTFSFTILNFCLGLFAFVSPFPQRTHEIC